VFMPPPLSFSAVAISAPPPHLLGHRASFGEHRNASP
jgi:hypothetical protein